MLPIGSRSHSTPPGVTKSASPGHLSSLACVSLARRPTPAAGPPVLARGHQKRVSTLRPPFPPTPQSLPWLCRNNVGRIFNFGEREDSGHAPRGLPPSPPAKVRPNFLGGYGPASGVGLVNDNETAATTDGPAPQGTRNIE